MRCPVCRAENDSGPQCRRCRADLGLLVELEERRARLLDCAAHHLATGAAEAALETAAQADRLLSDRPSRQLCALAHLLRRDFANAWRYYLAQGQR